MYVCMYVCVYTYIDVHTYIHTCTHIHTYRSFVLALGSALQMGAGGAGGGLTMEGGWSYLSWPPRVLICMMYHMYVCVDVCMDISTYLYIYIYDIYTHTHTRTHTHTHTRMQTHTHTHTHTRTQVISGVRGVSAGAFVVLLAALGPLRPRPNRCCRAVQW